VDVEQVVETLMDTLPECQVRHLAYATFAVLQVLQGREAYLVEYDTPPMIMVRQGQLVDLVRSGRVIAGRTIHESRFDLLIGDTLVCSATGTSTLGWRSLPDGLGLAEHRDCGLQLGTCVGDAYELKQALRSACLQLYDGKPAMTPPLFACESGRDVVPLFLRDRLPIQRGIARL